MRNGQAQEIAASYMPIQDVEGWEILLAHGCKEVLGPMAIPMS